MTFDEFLLALFKAGWIDRRDDRHENIRDLFDELWGKGLIRDDLKAEE